MEHSWSPIPCLRRAVAVVLCASTCTACERDFHDPSAPDTRWLEASYDAPEGQLSAQALPAAADTFYQRMQTLEQTQRFAVLDEMFSRVSDASVGAIAAQDADRGSRLAVVVNAQRTCEPGTDGGPSGAIHMTLKGDTHGLQPVIWGRFENCTARAGELGLTLNGDYSLTLREGPGGLDVLYRYEGTLQSAQARSQGAIDFRLRADGTLEVRVEGVDGDVILGLDVHGQQLARDRNGDWRCQLLQPRCERAGEVISGGTP